MLDAIFLVRRLICSDHVKLLSTYSPKIFSFVIIVRGSLLKFRSRLLLLSICFFLICNKHSLSFGLVKDHSIVLTPDV